MYMWILNINIYEHNYYIHLYMHRYIYKYLCVKKLGLVVEYLLFIFVNVYLKYTIYICIYIIHTYITTFEKGKYAQ